MHQRLRTSAFLPLLLVTVAHCAALAPQSARADWFGPSNYQECVEAYAVIAATKELAGFAMRSCSAAFKPGAHRIVRAYNLCTAEMASQAKTESVGQLIARTCARKHPSPACPEPRYFNFDSERCELHCDAGTRYDSSTETCSNPCPIGQVYLDRLNQCAHPCPAGSYRLGTAKCLRINDPYATQQGNSLSEHPRQPPTVIVFNGNRATEKSSKCVYKSAMSDAEIAACNAER